VNVYTAASEQKRERGGKRKKGTGIDVIFVQDVALYDVR
jgi:hypothetical protein